MKLMAIRLIENKEPVMIIGGHRKQWDDVDLFWRIDECTDPNQCEYIDFKIDDKKMCIMWSEQLENDGTGFCLMSDGLNLGESFQSDIYAIFEKKYGWNEITISLF